MKRSRSGEGAPERRSPASEIAEEEPEAEAEGRGDFSFVNRSATPGTEDKMRA